MSYLKEPRYFHASIVVLVRSVGSNNYRTTIEQLSNNYRRSAEEMAEGKLAGSHLLKNNQKEILEVADIFGDWGDKGGHGHHPCRQSPRCALEKL